MESLFVDVTPSSSNITHRLPNVHYTQVDYSEIVFPNFTQIKRLGRGAYGTVLQATFRNRLVAVKLVETEIDHVHIHTEASILHSFNHENIIKLYATFHGQESGLILELMEGGSLHDLLHTHRHIQYEPCHVLGWCSQVCSGLQYIHNRSLIHRDLKPSNMLLTNDFITLKLCDFGTAAPLRTSMTNNRGSAAWMAPEVFRGKRYDQKCDIFSFGIFIQPFDDWDSNAYTILWQVSEGRRPSLIDNCPSVIMSVIERCWSDDPQTRPTIDELVASIDICCEASDNVYNSLYSCLQIYPNRYLPLIDLTTRRQAFALPAKSLTPSPTALLPPPLSSSYGSFKAYSSPTPTSPTPRASPVSPSPPQPPPRLAHNRTGSYDLTPNGFRPEPAVCTSLAPHQAAPAEYSPLTTVPSSPGYTPCLQNMHPAQLPLSPPASAASSFSYSSHPSSITRRPSGPTFNDSSSSAGDNVSQTSSKRKKSFLQFWSHLR